jgi:histidyl-tRNA synthetase
VGEDEVAHGGGSDDFAYIELDYNSIAKLVVTPIPEVALDAFVKPTSKSVLDDTLLISSNLKDAGFKIEVDYDLDKKVEDYDTNYIIEISETGIKNYKVKLIDAKTKEEKEVMIDDLVEELAFI